MLGARYETAQLAYWWYPFDDAGPPPSRGGITNYQRRTPSVYYELFFPGGPSFLNDNPSGNQEWEQFRISTDPFDPSTMDYSTASIPAGIYRLNIQGLDLQNKNALRLQYRTICVDESGAPCSPVLQP